MEKVIIGKKESFEKGLFAALSQLNIGDTVEVCYSTKAYTQVLLSNWNNHKAGPDGPNYKAQTHKEMRAGKIESVLSVIRLK